MGYLKRKAKFPCGLELEHEMKGFGNPEFGDWDYTCTLHGKNCPPKSHIKKRNTKKRGRTS